ncbi:beta-propeller domain-containing protein [Virgibacillus kekensis]|uniref:Beta-propeller domain-containing protein n=1 Tax=Virgibacillus kekensis TaxID=202261 RepID=A0ABV9DN44_9BACI
MKKTYWLIIAAGLLVISAAAAFFLSNETTATIPSKSSYAPSFKDWTIHFSEKMNPDTFTEKTVRVENRDGEQIDVTLDWNEEQTILTLRAPEKGYTLNQSYKITVSNNVETASGQQLKKDFSHSFTAVAELPNIKDKEQLVTLLSERMEQRQQMFTEQSEGTAESSDGDAAMDTASSSNEQKSSKTNVQVNGIDEGDIIKTDGKYVYFSRESDVVITSAEGNNSSVLSTISYENFHPAEIYLHKDLLVMIGHTSKPIREPRIADEPGSAEKTSLPVHSTQTTALIYDVSDRNNPKKVREVSFEGSLNSSRLMDGQLYLIANQHPPYHILRDDSQNTLKKTELRPYIFDTVEGTKGRPLDFDSMFFFPESQEESFLMLGSIDLDNLKKRANIQAYLGASNQIYMSENHLYIAVHQYNYKKRDTNGAADIAIAMPPANTEISQFKIDKGKITFNASTVVPGSLINQFAMDERDGIFRVATTKGNMWRGEEPSTNNLYTFDMQMNPVGSLEGLAENERIYSVRFMDNVAYMVTFRQVDPLFVIDLKDPAKPTVLGKLKIPGFSNYLHPLDENHVIGFGQNTKLVESKHSKEPQVRMDGLKISVFDVSNPVNPVEKYSEIIGQGHSMSEINHDHNVLYEHPENNIYGFPATLFESKIVQQGDATFEDQKFVYEGAFLYNITPEKGIKLKDTITHQENMNIDYPDWASQVKRMVSVGNTLYTFSLNQMKVYDLSSEKVIKTVDLPELKERF